MKMIADERKQEKIKCKICGRWCVFVGSHVFKKHHITARHYKKMFGYNVAQGLVPEWYRERLADLVTEESKANLVSGGLKEGPRDLTWSQEEREKHTGFKHSEKTKKMLSEQTSNRLYSLPSEFEIDRLTCQICGRKVIRLEDHVRRMHKITQIEYKTRFRLPLKTGLIPNWLRRKKHKCIG